jgi:SAM-dependent methyltransferase
MAQRVDPTLSARAQAALQDCAQGRLPPNLAAMHLLIDGADLSAFEIEIARAQEPESAERLRQARAFATESAAALVPRLSALLNHNPGLDPADAVARWAAAFDAAVAAQPEASVALYSLGDPRLLDAASREIASALQDWGLTGPDGSFDLVLAVDSFPYLHLSAIAESTFAEAARLIAPGGHLAIFNYSYRDDFEADRRDLDRLAKAHGLDIVRRGTRDFVLWDGASFVLRKPER